MVAKDVVPINEPIQYEMPPEHAVVEEEDVAMDEDIRSEATTTCSNYQTKSSLSATEWKEQGNTLFQQNKFAESLEAYDHALKSLEHGEPSTAPHTNEMELVVSLFSNRALVLFKMRQFQLAEQECSKALEMDPDNVKGACFWKIKDSIFGQEATSSHFFDTFHFLQSCSVGPVQERDNTLITSKTKTIARQ
jgi:tetratricopeptide (TPR) repeat protein